MTRRSLRWLVLALAGGAAGVSPARGDEGVPAGEAAPPAPKAETSDPAASRVAFEQAEVAREEERWKEAADLYWKAIEADRAHYVAHVRYQEAQARAGGAHADMVTDYDSFLTEYPGDPSLRLHRLRLDAPADRIPALEALLKASPKDPLLLLETGRAQLEAGDAARAAKPLAEALAALGAARLDVLLLAAEAEFRAGRTAEARGRLEKAVAAQGELHEAHLLLARFDLLEGKWAEAERRGDLCLGLKPTWVTAALVKAEALARQAKYDAAVATLDTMKGHGRETEDLVLALAELLSRPKDEEAWKAATVLFEKVLAQDPEDGRAPYGLAWILERQGKFEEAEKRYRACAERRPRDAAPVNSVGFCLLKQGKITDAQVQFKKAADLDPTFTAALANLGATYDAQANYAEAIKTYDKILKMKGQDGNLRVLVNCAFDYEALGTFPKAEEYLRRARKIDPEDPLIATWLGDNLYFQEKWKDAEKAYQEAIAIDEKCFYAHRGHGYTLGRQKKWADAVAALEKARELKPDAQDVLVALGDIYLVELQDLEKALKAYEQYVQVGGTDPSIPELIQEIRKELDARK